MGVLVNDVDRLILEAWEKLGPGIVGDHDELQRRLARRRSKLFERPQRAWCVCLRASDRRITAWDWTITPEHAMRLDHPEHPYEPIEHEVIIQPHGLRKFCRPVRTDSRGELVEEVAKRLGVKPCGMDRARKAGKFRERFVKGLMARRGKPVPLIHSWNTLDPSGAHFQRCDVLWGALWEFLPDMVRDGFEQTVVRRPVFWDAKPARLREPIVDRDALTPDPLAGSASSARFSRGERPVDQHALTPALSQRERGKRLDHSGPSDTFWPHWQVMGRSWWGRRLDAFFTSTTMPQRRQTRLSPGLAGSGVAVSSGLSSASVTSPFLSIARLASLSARVFLWRRLCSSLACWN